MMQRIVAFLSAAKGWRTIAISLVLAVAGVLQTADWSRIVGPDQVGPVMLAVGILVAVLRVMTDTPVGRTTRSGRDDA